MRAWCFVYFTPPVVESQVCACAQHLRKPDTSISLEAVLDMKSGKNPGGGSYTCHAERQSQSNIVNGGACSFGTTPMANTTQRSISQCSWPAQMLRCGRSAMGFVR